MKTLKITYVGLALVFRVELKKDIIIDKLLFRIV